MATETQNTNSISTLVTDLSDIEKQLISVLGPEILDYIFLFSKEESLDIKIEQTSPQTERLMLRYIEIIEKLVSLYELKLDKTGKKTPEIFLEAMHDLYIMRYLEARLEFAEYQLVRVPTKLERSIIKSMDVPKDQKFLPSTITFAIPDAFVINDFGVLDFQATSEREKRENIMKSYLSALTEFTGIRDQMIDDLDDITVYGMVPLLYVDELRLLNETVAETCYMYFTPRLYSYLARGMSPGQAKANLNAYYRKITNNTESKFPPQLEDLEDQVVKVITDGLRAMKSLYPETRKVLLEDYKELLLYYINSGLFTPVNLYQLRFRPPEQFDKDERKFNFLIDLYLVMDDGNVLPEPFETYNVDFTHEAKYEIFNAVTNGLENPKFTLNDYLAEEN
ncbi:MAG: hypothetical protein ACE5DX_01090 [Candidatus Dojkabacteria bacterium]